MVVRNEEHKKLTSAFDWYLLTVANPDGYVQTFSGHRYEKIFQHQLSKYYKSQDEIKAIKLPRDLKLPSLY